MSTHSDRELSVATDPCEWLDRYGDALYRYAIIRVRRVDVAEDLVQETLLAGLKSRKNFSGLSSEQTWLTGILVRKIGDYFRRQSRERRLRNDEQETGRGQSDFDERGHWISRLRRWPGSPQDTLEIEDFWHVFAECMSNLPPTLSSAFSLREFDELDTQEIAEILGISTTNVGVRLYRARLLLRHCLEVHWFDSPSK